MIELSQSVCPLDGLFLERMNFGTIVGVSLRTGILAVVDVASLYCVGILYLLLPIIYHEEYCCSQTQLNLFGCLCHHYLLLSDHGVLQSVDVL